MPPVVVGLAFIVISVALAAVAYKWTGVNPHRVEDSPSWWGALWAGTLATILLLVAFGMLGTPRAPVGTLIYWYACGSVVAPAFWVSFGPSSEEQPNFILRWLSTKMEGAADGVFKFILTVPLSFLLGAVGIQIAGFWAVLVLACFFSLAKAGVVQSAIRSTEDRRLFEQRKRVLMHRSVLVSAFIGTAAMGVWAIFMNASASAFPSIGLDDLVAALRNRLS